MDSARDAARSSASMVFHVKHGCRPIKHRKRWHKTRDGVDDADWLSV